MADRKKCVSENVDGEFFVDSTCIDCDTCRQLAPETFGEAEEYSYVSSQPRTADEQRNAMRALLCCPVGSIGMLHPHPVKDVTDDFPLLLEDNVFYTGFNSPKSFGGNSYFIWHPDGNWLIDSPKYLPHLVQAFSSLGGIRYIFLTHRDDVADAEKYAKKFGGKRIIHRLELPSQPDAEIVIDGREPNQLSPEFLAVPTPGHTRGHCVLLHKGRFLFTGDHLWWSRPKNRLHASEAVCWYSWDEQCVSMHRLKRYGFEWVLPGHGQRIRLSREAMQQQLAGLVDRMENRSHTFVNRNKVAETQ